MDSIGTLVVDERLQEAMKRVRRQFCAQAWAFQILKMVVWS